MKQKTSGIILNSHTERKQAPSDFKNDKRTLNNLKIIL